MPPDLAEGRRERALARVRAGQATVGAIARGIQLAAEDHTWRIKYTWEQAAIPSELTGRRIETWPGAGAVLDYLLTWVRQ